MTKRIATDRQKYLITIALDDLKERGALIHGKDGVYLNRVTIDDVLARLDTHLERAGVPIDGGVSISTLHSLIAATTGLKLRTPRRLTELSMLRSSHEKLVALLIDKGIFEEDEL